MKTYLKKPIQYRRFHRVRRALAVGDPAGRDKQLRFKPKPQHMAVAEAKV